MEHPPDIIDRPEVLVREIPARRRLLAQHRQTIHLDELVRTHAAKDEDTLFLGLLDASLPVGVILFREVAIEVDPDDLLSGLWLNARNDLEQPELVRRHERVKRAELGDDAVL